MGTQILQKWDKVKLSELGSVDRGRSRHRPRNDASLYGGTYPFVQTGDVKSANFYITSYSQTYNEKGLAQSKIWDPGTLCITIAANIGESAILKIPACFPDSIVGFRSYEGISDVRFVKYFLDFLKNQFQAISKGTTQDNLSLDKLLSIDLNVPNYLTQTHIADFLIAYDNLIENNARRIQILEQMAQAIYMEWFVNDPKLRKQKVKLSEVVKPQYGYTESASDKPIGPKYLRGTDINKQNFIDWSAVPYCKISDEDKKKYQLRKGDIVVIRMADPGKIGIVEQNIDGVFASYLIRLEIIDKCISPYYLFYFLNSSEYQNYIKGASGGTTRKSASAGVVIGTDIVIPPAELLGQFEKKILLLRSELNNLLNQNANLRQTRDLLLPKLVTGEIEVK